MRGREPCAHATPSCRARTRRSVACYWHVLLLAVACIADAGVTATRVTHDSAHTTSHLHGSTTPPPPPPRRLQCPQEAMKPQATKPPRKNRGTQGETTQMPPMPPTLTTQSSPRRGTPRLQGASKPADKQSHASLCDLAVVRSGARVPMNEATASALALCDTGMLKPACGRQAFG
jgi:hypothetical protein